MTQEQLDALAGPVQRHGAWVIYDSAMEHLRFDGRPPLHPASHPALTDRTITVGSASKELRMIGWRVGWVVGPAPVIADIGLVGLTNVVCQVGIAQQAVTSRSSDSATSPPGSGLPCRSRSPVPPRRFAERAGQTSVASRSDRCPSSSSR